MKKLLLFLIILGVGGYFAYRYYVTPEKRSCARLAQLCGFKSDDHQRCVSQLADLGRNANSESMAKFHDCVAGAKTCAEGSGCLVGAGLSAAGNLFHSFLEGVEKAFHK
ncbi:MAG TPA: hypothetical protein VKN99_23895 [Polyangia bacterium]|nr:hypothetical protein [Polyangia bacterium]